MGILSLGQVFRRQGWIALRVVGGCGFVGAVAWWVLRNWAEVQEWISGGGNSNTNGMVGVLASPIAVPAPERGWWEGWVGLVKRPKGHAFSPMKAYDYYGYEGITI